MWYPKDLKHLSPAENVTEPQYCSRSARQAMYTIAAQLSDSGDGIEDWGPEWDVVALMKSGVYYNNFKSENTAQANREYNHELDGSRGTPRRRQTIQTKNKQSAQIIITNGESGSWGTSCGHINRGTS